MPAAAAVAVAAAVVAKWTRPVAERRSSAGWPADATADETTTAAAAAETTRASSPYSTRPKTTPRTSAAS